MNSSLSMRVAALDTALIGNLSRDYFSKDTAARARAYAFIKALTSLGVVPLLSWHHVEELLKHENLSVARTRFRFLQSLPVVAWLSAYNEPRLPGSVVDILAYEAAAAFQHPELNAVGIRDLVRPKLYTFGSGEQALAGLDNGLWEWLRPLFRQREDRAREIIAIARAKHIDISKEKASTFINGTLRTPEETARAFTRIQEELEAQIATRGDQRISDPSAVASEFMNEVIREGVDLLQGPSEGRARLFERWGVYAKDLVPTTLMGDVSALGTFRSQLEVANRYMQLPWDRLIEIVKPTRIPSWMIINSLRLHSQDMPEWKGSDLTDSHLAVLSAYSNFTFVDKRTNENLTRASRKEADVRTLILHADKGGHYFTLPDRLRQWDRTRNQAENGLPQDPA